MNRLNVFAGTKAFMNDHELYSKDNITEITGSINKISVNLAISSHFLSDIAFISIITHINGTRSYSNEILFSNTMKSFGSTDIWQHSIIKRDKIQNKNYLFSCII
jgi:hypothetical protein